MCAAQNCVYGSTLSPPRQKQIRDAVWAHMDSMTAETDALFQMHLPFIAQQMGMDISSADAVEELYTSLRHCELLRKEGERISMGKYQQPVHGTRRSLPWFSVKAFLYNAACMTVGHKGADRLRPPPRANGDQELEVPAERLTPAQQNALPWSEQCANQLDRAAYLFGNIDNACLQQQIVR
eukprot:3041099-Pyramimonas_sp.AAC.1